MKVNKIIKTGTEAYNKYGYRLASVVSLSVPRDIQKTGVRTLKRAEIEHKSGEQFFVESMLDKAGKLIQSTHYSSLKPDEMTKIEYAWSRPADCKNDVFGKNIRHFYIKTDEYTFTEQNVKYTNLDINTKRKTVTKSVGMQDVGKGINSSEIYSIQNGKKTKGIVLKAEKQQDGLYKNTYTGYFGIPDEDAAKVLRDKYFNSRFTDNGIMAKNCIAQAAKNQKIHCVPKLFGYANSENVSGSDFSAKTIYLAQNALNNRVPKKTLVNILEHECKHFQQHELVEKYNKGKLTNYRKIMWAKQYKNDFENYISAKDKANLEEYYNQTVEREAYALGEMAERRYALVTKHLKRIFKGASDSTAGA